MRKFPTKVIILWFAVILVGVGLYNYNQSITYNTIQMDFSDFVQETESGNVHDVLIKGTKIVGHLNNGTMFFTVAPYQDRDLVARLMEHKVKIKASMPDEGSNSFLAIFLSWLPMLFLIGIWVFFIRRMGQGSSRAMGFGRIKPKKNESKEKTTFKDVAGADEAKEELEEIVQFLKHPKKYQKLGGRMPKGVLLVGPPGTGKTLLARAVAGEANCPFYAVSASEFVEMFVGVGASRVRDLFDKARQTLPCIIFIDEIDAMGRHRGVGLGGGNDEREQTLNEFLVQLDGFAQNKGLVVFGATNRPDVLDKALTRSGRFDRQVIVSLPTVKQREAILAVHARKITVAAGVDWAIVAQRTTGFSGADLENVVNEAALLAARKDKTAVDMHDFEEAIDKIILGPERRSLVMKEDEKKRTAYHEAGHTIVAYHSKNSDPIYKVTILPRGMTGGRLETRPEDDQTSITKIKMVERIRILMAGRVAESAIFGPDFVATGASHDIKVATDIAKKMVMEYGMSDVCGMMNYQDANEIHFGHVSPANHHSQEFARILDTEVKKILDDAYSFAKHLLEIKLDKLHALASALLEKEILTGQEVAAILE